MGAGLKLQSPLPWFTLWALLTGCTVTHSARVDDRDEISLTRSAQRVMEADIWSARIQQAHHILNTAEANAVVLAQAADTLRAARYASLRGDDVPMGLEHVRQTARLVEKLEHARRRALRSTKDTVPPFTASRAALFNWPVTEVAVSSEFGHRTDPFRPTERTFHNGIDLVTPEGAPVFSAAPGTIHRAGWRDDGCGLSVAISHGNGYETEYCHLGVVMVEQGGLVGQGSVIGRVGRTGRTTGTHLHFTVRVGGQAVDPRWMIGRSVDG